MLLKDLVFLFVHNCLQRPGVDDCETPTLPETFVHVRCIPCNNVIVLSLLWLHELLQFLWLAKSEFVCVCMQAVSCGFIHNMHGQAWLIECVCNVMVSLSISSVREYVGYFRCGRHIN